MAYKNIMLKNMTNKELADKLELHQRWRRGELEEMPLPAKVLGLVIDEVIERLRDEKICDLLSMWLEEARKSCRANYRRWREHRLSRESWLESPGTKKMFEWIRETKKLLKLIRGE